MYCEHNAVPIHLILYLNLKSYSHFVSSLGFWTSSKVLDDGILYPLSGRSGAVSAWLALSIMPKSCIHTTVCVALQIWFRCVKLGEYQHQLVYHHIDLCEAETVWGWVGPFLAKWMGIYDTEGLGQLWLNGWSTYCSMDWSFIAKWVFFDMLQNTHLQGNFLFNHCTTTGFSPFKLLTCSSL